MNNGYDCRTIFLIYHLQSDILWTRLGILHHENGDVILIADNVVIHIHSELKQVDTYATFPYYSLTLTFFHASGDFCRLLINFANSLDPDQDRQN